MLQFGGGGGIRTPGTVSGTAVFKTAALNHSATPPRSQFSGALPHLGSSLGARRLNHSATPPGFQSRRASSFVPRYHCLAHFPSDNRHCAFDRQGRRRRIRDAAPLGLRQAGVRPRADPACGTEAGACRSSRFARAMARGSARGLPSCPRLAFPAGVRRGRAPRPPIALTGREGGDGNLFRRALDDPAGRHKSWDASRASRFADSLGLLVHHAKESIHAVPGSAPLRGPGAGREAFLMPGLLKGIESAEKSETKDSLQGARGSSRGSLSRCPIPSRSRP